MTDVLAGRLFANHYQIMICDSLDRPISDEENWNDEKITLGFAGGPSCRLIGTEADLNDHWVELVEAEHPPRIEEWQRVTCVSFYSETGHLLLMSVIDDEPLLKITVGKGYFSVYFAANNLGIDQLSLKEEKELDDDELAIRKDLEWYRVFVIPGKPSREGRIRDVQI